MKRNDFLKLLSLGFASVSTMKLKALERIASTGALTERMPVLFLGHGSPMNAIEENEFVQGFRAAGRGINHPSAVLCVSAHWETRGTHVTAMEYPRTIHDFGGFPQELFEVQYPAPGSPALARLTQEIVTRAHVEEDHQWGLDHGAWSVIKHLYPDANVPVIQLSLDVGMTPAEHYALAQELKVLRERGILIVGSGNMVHNLRMVAWDKLNEADYGYDWAHEAADTMRSAILARDHKPLIDFRKQGRAFDLAIPTAEHFLPLIYSLGMTDVNEEVSLFNDKAIGGSLTMTSVKIG